MDRAHDVRAQLQRPPELVGLDLEARHVAVMARPALTETECVQRLLGGGNEDTGKLLGLDKEWLARAVKAVGNYGESYDRNLGPKPALNLPRGLNNLWNKGGPMYPYPAR